MRVHKYWVSKLDIIINLALLITDVALEPRCIRKVFRLKKKNNTITEKIIQ